MMARHHRVPCIVWEMILVAKEVVKMFVCSLIIVIGNPLNPKHRENVVAMIRVVEALGVHGVKRSLWKQIAGGHVNHGVRPIPMGGTISVPGTIVWVVPNVI